MKLLLILLLLTTPAYACDCAPPPPPAQALKTMAAVFIGTVTNIQKVDKTPDLIITFTADRAWKGIDKPDVTVHTAAGGAACGYLFETGKSYLVYAYAEDKTLRTNICTRTCQSTAAQADLAELGEPKQLEEKK